MEEPEAMPFGGMYDRTLQENRTLYANRSLAADEFDLLFGGYNRSLEYYNRSLFSEANRSLFNRTMF